jgi:hypothetical protein
MAKRSMPKVEAVSKLIGELLKLPDDAAVYPVHDYEWRTSSTIGEERRFNPRLKLSPSNPRGHCSRRSRFSARGRKDFRG